MYKILKSAEYAELQIIEKVKGFDIAARLSQVFIKMNNIYYWTCSRSAFWIAGKCKVRWQNLIVNNEKTKKYQSWHCINAFIGIRKRFIAAAKCDTAQFIPEKAIFLFPLFLIIFPYEYNLCKTILLYIT